MKVELFKYTLAGVRYWAVEPDYDMGSLEIEHGLLNGVMQYQTEDIEINKSGRDLIEQVDLRLNARIKAKRDIGYRDSVDESKAVSGNNTLGFHRPMLAKRLDRTSKVSYHKSFLQMKYDGPRCLVTKTGDGKVAYSRQGRLIKSIGHILDSMRIPTGATIDGELYHHGTPLQTISSWVKRKQHSTTKLEYVVYDIIMEEPYSVRYNLLKGMDLGLNARLAPTDRSVYSDQIPLLLRNAIESGYEGLILRQDKYPYEPGKRSNGLIKIKEFQDGEYLVVNVHESADGWGILECVTEKDKHFRVSAPGQLIDKREILANKINYIGKYITIKYANLTSDGVPFHPVAERWKEDI